MPFLKNKADPNLGETKASRRQFMQVKEKARE